MIPTATAKTSPLATANYQGKPNNNNHHMGKHPDKHESKLATLAKQQQQQGTNVAHQETEIPNRSISNSPTLKPRNNLSARHVGATTTITKTSAAPADKAATTVVGVPSVAACAAATAAEHSAAPQDSYFEQHQHPTETPSGSPPHYYQPHLSHQRSVTKASSENCARLSSRMLDSDISISSLESRRSSVSSLRTVQSACRHSFSNNNNINNVATATNTTNTTAITQYNNVTQHPAWLASAGFMRRTKCTACNPTSGSEHRRSLSRSSSMYDVAAAAAVAAQHQHSTHNTLRRLSRTSLTDDNGNMKPNNNRRIVSADGIIDSPLTPIPNSTATFIRQHQQLYGNNRSAATPTTTTASTTAAAAMAAAAAVVSAAAATAATTNPDPANEKWMQLIGNCINHSSKLERLAHDLLASEQHATDMLEVHESIEDSQKSRDQQYQVRVKECEALVRVQREMLVEMENILSEQGFKKEINLKQQQQQMHQHELTTPPPSSPSESSASSSSSAPSVSDDQQQQEEGQQEDQLDQKSCSENEEIQKSSTVLKQEQDAERSGQDQKKQAEESEEQEEPSRGEEGQVTQESPESCQDLIQPQSDDNEQDKPWSEIVEDTVSQIRWNVSQWVGGGVGTGQIVKCEIGADGLMSTIIVAGTGVTTEPRLLPKVNKYYIIH